MALRSSHGFGLLVALLCCASITLTTAALAGREELHHRIVLTATTNAPLNATGKAELEVDEKDSTDTAAFAIEFDGLLPGQYTISVTRKSDGSSVSLATFESENAGGFGNDDALPLPAGLDPLDIAGISISDAHGVVLLAGNFLDDAEVNSGSFKVEVSVTAGPAAPAARGRALVQSKIMKGTRKAKFRLVASGAAPNEVLTLKINGVDVGTVTADKHGRVHMRELPADVDPESLILMEFDDGTGTNALTINF